MSARSFQGAFDARPSSLLLVDGDAELSAMLQRFLQTEGWSVRVAHSAKIAEQSLAEDLPALALVDVVLPDASGVHLCRRWRASHPGLAIMMLTARSDSLDGVPGLQAGADDCLAKPFEKRQLAARLRALVRREALSASESGKGSHLGPAPHEAVSPRSELEPDRDGPGGP